MAFEQLYLGEAPESGTIERSLRSFQSNAVAEEEISSLGVRTLLPPGLGLSPPEAVDGVFGTGFFDRLAELPVGVWTGPVQSSYGVHLVQIVERVPARTPPLEEIRDAVLKDWRVVKAQRLRELHFERLRERYVIEIEGTVDPAAGER